MKKGLILAGIALSIGIFHMALAAQPSPNVQETEKNKKTQVSQPTDKTKPETPAQQAEQIFGGPKNIKASPKNPPNTNPFQNLLQKQTQ